MQRSIFAGAVAATLFLGAVGVGTAGATAVSITSLPVPAVPAQPGPPAKPSGAQAAAADPALLTRVFNAITVSVPTTDTDGNGSAESWFGGRVRIELTTGSIYNIPVAQGGATTAPNPFAWGFAPQTAFDTYLNTRNYGAATLLGGVSPTNEDTGTAEGLDTPNAQVLSAIWVDAMPVDVNGTFQIAQFVLSGDATGRIFGNVLVSDAPTQAGIPINLAIVGGVIVPEPAGLGAVLLVGAGLLARRRRAS